MRVLVRFLMIVGLSFGSTLSVVHSQEAPSQQLNTEVGLYDLEWHPSDDLFAVASDWGVRLLDDELDEIAQLEDETDGAVGVSWNPDGTQLAVAQGVGDNRVTNIWNCDSVEFQLEATLPRNYNGEFVVAWSPDGIYLATLSIDSTQQTSDAASIVQIWDTSTWELEITIPFTILAPMRKLEWSADSSRVVFGGDYGLHVFDLGTQETVFDTFNITGFSSFALSENGSLAIAEPSGIMIFNDSTWEMDTHFDQSAGRILWRHEDAQLIFPNSMDEISVLDLASGHILSTFTITYSQSDGQTAVNDFDLSSDENLLAVGSSDGIISIWNLDELIEE